MKRFGYFVRLGGDREIAEALRRGADGAMMARPGASSEAVRRVAMMRHTPEEWRRMTRRARKKYGRNEEITGVRGALLVGVAMVVLAVGGIVDTVWEAVERSGRA